MIVANKLFKLVPLLLISMFALNAQAGWDQESVTMQEGETKTMYLPSSVTSLNLKSVSFYSASIEYVEVLSYTNYSVTIKAKKATSSPVIVRCDYYYYYNNNGYIYTYSGAYDYKVTVTGSGGSGGGGNNGPTSLYVTPTSMTLKVGETATITAVQEGAIGGTYFTSNNTSIATVTSGQLTGAYSYSTVATVTAVSPGSVNIWAKNANGLQAYCYVTVEDNTFPPGYMFTYNGLKYKVNNDGKTVSVASYQDKNLNGAIDIPNIVYYTGTSFRVTSIGNDAFYYCTGLTSVTIPNSVTSIGNHAFSYCSGLTSVAIGNSVTSIDNDAFFDCSGLTSVTIPNSVTSIGDRAFSFCTSLTSVTIPKSVIEIGNTAFSACSGFTSIVVGSGNPKYDSRNNCNAIIETATNTLVAGCKNTIIPNSVTAIARTAFYRQTGLTSVTIPNSVTSIGDLAFLDCTGLTSVSIPNSVTEIGESAFNNCTGLTSVSIPNSVTSIGYEAFSGCRGFTSIVVGSGNPKYDSRNNCNAIIETATNTLVAGCKNTVIPNSVTAIARSAFCRQTSLTSVTIPNSVTSIGDCAFQYCTGLTSVSIPNSVTSIGESTFSGCTGLISIWSRIEKPENVTLGSNVFYNVDKSFCTLYVPAGTVSKYRAVEQWKDFVNILEEESAINTVDVDMAKMLVTKGHISVAGAREVTVYDLKGVLVNTGSETDVAPGTYIVVADGEIIKVLVR